MALAGNHRDSLRWSLLLRHDSLSQNARGLAREENRGWPAETSAHATPISTLRSPNHTFARFPTTEDLRQAAGGTAVPK